MPDKFRGTRSRHFKNPLECYCLATKYELSGTISHHWKCWWYDKPSKKRRFASFSANKYGDANAQQLCIDKLHEENAKQA